MKFENQTHEHKPSISISNKSYLQSAQQPSTSHKPTESEVSPKSALYNPKQNRETTENKNRTTSTTVAPAKVLQVEMLCSVASRNLGGETGGAKHPIKSTIYVSYV